MRGSGWAWSRASPHVEWAEAGHSLSLHRELSLYNDASWLSVNVCKPVRNSSAFVFLSIESNLKTWFCCFWQRAALAQRCLCGAVYHLIAWSHISAGQATQLLIALVLTTLQRGYLVSVRSWTRIYLDTHSALMLITMFRNISPTRGPGQGRTGFGVGGLTNSSSFETWQLSALACTPDPNRQSERKWQQSGPISLRDAGWAGHTHPRDTGLGRQHPASASARAP